MNIIGHRKIFLSVSATLVVLSLGLILIYGFKPAIDFKGGTLWQFRIPTEKPNLSELENLFQSETKEARRVKFNLDLTNNTFLARLEATSEENHQKLTDLIKSRYPSFEELSFQSIGPSVGQKLRENALKAVILAIVIVSLYITFAFRKVSKPISSWKYGVVTMVTLLHDIAIPASLIALLGRLSDVEIDSNFIVALLVVMGFSVHDTIVVFDRIRENLSLDRGRTDFGGVINQSINQTLARSINTSLTLVIVLLALFFLGPLSFKYFILTLLVGVSAGVYSSVFVASPMLLVWQKLTRK